MKLIPLHQLEPCKSCPSGKNLPTNLGNLTVNLVLVGEQIPGKNKNLQAKTVNEDGIQIYAIPKVKNSSVEKLTQKESPYEPWSNSHKNKTKQISGHFHSPGHIELPQNETEDELNYITQRSHLLLRRISLYNKHGSHHLWERGVIRQAGGDVKSAC